MYFRWEPFSEEQCVTPGKAGEKDRCVILYYFYFFIIFFFNCLTWQTDWGVN